MRTSAVFATEQCCISDKGFDICRIDNTTNDDVLSLASTDELVLGLYDQPQLRRKLKLQQNFIRKNFLFPSLGPISTHVHITTTHRLPRKCAAFILVMTLANVSRL